MPFDSPKPGPRDADSFASFELESLADQLSRDAQWLAYKYPAHKPKLPLKQPRRLRWVAVGAAAVLLLLCVDGWLMWTRPAAGPSPELSEKNIAAAKTPPAGSLAGARSEAPVPRRMPLETRLPGLSLKDLNGAEKEAVLDLLEQRAPAPTNTSLSL